MAAFSLKCIAMRIGREFLVLPNLKKNGTCVDDAVVLLLWMGLELRHDERIKLR